MQFGFPVSTMKMWLSSGEKAKPFGLEITGDLIDLSGYAIDPVDLTPSDFALRSMTLIVGPYPQRIPEKSFSTKAFPKTHWFMRGLMISKSGDSIGLVSSSSGKAKSAQIHALPR